MPPKPFTEADVTDDWVRATITAGYFAAAVDMHNGNGYWMNHLRMEVNVNITWDVVETIKQAGREAGIPESRLALPEIIERRLHDPVWMKKAREIQTGIVRAHNAAHKAKMN